MKTIWNFLHVHRRILYSVLLIIIALIVLYSFRLSSLTGGISRVEYTTAHTPIGWHGIWQQPLYLPLLFLRSVIFKLFHTQSIALLRVPSIVFAILAVLAVAGVLKIWYGNRTALFGTVLFATASWTLHVARLASTDALYLSIVPLIILSHALTQRYFRKSLVYFGTIIMWCILLYVPGVVWFLIINKLLLRKELVAGWRLYGRWWQRTIYVLLGIIWLPLLIRSFIRHPNTIRIWLGLPEKFASFSHTVKQFLAVFVHLFVRGPQYPQLWLARTPVLDVMALAMCVIGIYFYVRHYKAIRTRFLFSIFLAGVILISLGGPVPLSLLVPLLYLFVASGIAYMIREWFRVFPKNPFARNFGVIFITVAVVLSCFYNLRSYFIVWPHDATTRVVFNLKD
jgi:hypothetical protein